MFECGQTVLVQEVWQGKVWSARPMIVAEDRPDFIALWFPQGTVWQAPTTPDDAHRAETRGERLTECLSREERAYRQVEWDVSSIWLAWPEARLSIWPSWTDEFTPLGWYVNLQEAFVRTGRGFHWMDQMLDIIASLTVRLGIERMSTFDSLVECG